MSNVKSPNDQIKGFQKPYKIEFTTFYYHFSYHHNIFYYKHNIEQLFFLQGVLIFDIKCLKVLKYFPCVQVIVYSSLQIYTNVRCFG